jgi:Fungal tRNA ligase phosphodiesterase domain
MGYDHAKFSGKKEEDRLVLALEDKLRKSISEAQDELLAKTVSLKKSQEAFIRQLCARIQSLSVAIEPEDPMDCDGAGSNEGVPKVKLVAVDVAKASVHSLLRQESTSGPVGDFLEMALEGSPLECWNDDHYVGELFVERTHVTMQFWKETSQESIQESFGPLLGATVDLQATGLLWDDQVAALEVSVSKTTQDGKDVPPSRNEFVHITIWVAKTAQAQLSNKLPSKLNQGVAKKVVFAKPAPLKGTISFWDF